MLEEIMKELAQLGEVYYYVPKNYPARMVSSQTEDDVQCVLLEVEMGLTGWRVNKYGKYIRHDLPCCWTILIGDKYYFMS
jgi:hypothetical protein